MGFHGGNKSMVANGRGKFPGGEISPHFRILKKEIGLTPKDQAN